MSEDDTGATAIQALKIIAAPVVLAFAILVMKLIGLVEEIHPLRVRAVKRGWLSFSEPEPTAIRTCPKCDYRGTLAVDKHRPAPMSDTNWGLFCPDCRHEFAGPIDAADAGEYINQCRETDVFGGMLVAGNYAAVKAVQGHNARHALSVAQIRELTEASYAQV